MRELLALLLLVAAGGCNAMPPEPKPVELRDNLHWQPWAKQRQCRITPNQWDRATL